MGNTEHSKPGSHAPGHQQAVPLEVAFDFVNTLEFEREGSIDHLPTTAAALDWLRQHELLDPEECAEAGVDERTLGRIRRARAALRELVDTSVGNRPPPRPAIDEVNRLLRERDVLALRVSDDGITLGQHCLGDPVVGALSRLAEPIARALAGPERGRVKTCANDTCRWVFEDTSRAGRRRWCDMASCGNRAKAARHRARTKRGGEPPEPDLSRAPAAGRGLSASS